MTTDLRSELPGGPLWTGVKTTWVGGVVEIIDGWQIFQWMVDASQRLGNGRRGAGSNCVVQHTPIRPASRHNLVAPVKSFSRFSMRNNNGMVSEDALIEWCNCKNLDHHLAQLLISDPGRTTTTPHTLTTLWLRSSLCVIFVMSIQRRNPQILGPGMSVRNLANGKITVLVHEAKRVIAHLRGISVGSLFSTSGASLGSLASSS